MKPSAMVNLAAFCVSAFGIAASVVELSAIDYSGTAAMAGRLDWLTRHRGQVSRNLLVSENLEDVSQDALAMSLKLLRSNATSLRQLAAGDQFASEPLAAPCQKAAREMEAFCDQVEQLRSSRTVLRNTSSTLRARIAGWAETHGADAPGALSSVPQLLAVLPSANQEMALSQLKIARDSISRTIGEETSAAAIEERRLIRALIDKVIATARFVVSDFSKIVAMERRGTIGIARDQVRAASQLASSREQAALRRLSVASAALVAFGCVGLLRFRSQAAELARLNEDLESRVEERTLDLASSQALLSSVLDALPSHIAILDRDGNIVQTNEGWQQFADENGGPAKDAAINYLEICRSATGECRESALNLADTIEAIIQTGSGSYSGEYACHSTEEQRWFHVTVTRLADTSRGSVVVAHSCITERVRMESELQRQKEEAERLALVAKYTDNAVVITDANSRIEWVNEGFTRQTGYTLNEVVGLVPGDFLQGAETDPAAVELMRQRIAANQGFDVEIVNYDRNGNKYWNAIEARPIEDENGNVTKFIAIESNVTGRKQSEQEISTLLAKSEEQRALLDTVMNSASDGIIAATSELGLFCFNPRAEAILGRGPSYGTDPTLWGSNYQLYNAEGSEPLELEQLPLYRAVQGETLINHELVVRREDGDITISASGGPLQSDEFGGGVVIFRDITEQKRLEQQLSQAQKLESIGQLAAGIAHEINTPMQFLGDNIEFLSECAGRLFTVVDRYRDLLEGESPMSWQERREEITRIAEQCRFERIRSQVPGAIEECREGIQRTVGILKAMKDFSHPGTKTKVLADLNQAIQSTVTISRNRWKYAAELDLDLDPALPMAPVHLGEINQVLLNLVVNAADAVAERHGEGNLGRIAVRTRHVDDHILIEVEDNGCGMPDHVAAKAFDPFFTTKAVGKGTGQGLSIAHNVVVSMHAGDIDLSSAEGEGTTFRLRLPTTAEEDPGPEHALNEPSDAATLITA